MAENKKFVITVGRQYGSGGAEMAKRLGERLGLHVYDKEILKMTSEESGIRESYFHLADEKAGNKLLYRIIHSLIPENGTPSLGSDLISSDNLFRFQSVVVDVVQSKLSKPRINLIRREFKLSLINFDFDGRIKLFFQRFHQFQINL